MLRDHWQARARAPLLRHVLFLQPGTQEEAVLFLLLLFLRNLLFGLQGNPVLLRPPGQNHHHQEAKRIDHLVVAHWIRYQLRTRILAYCASW